jgi:hypothetical protein
MKFHFWEGLEKAFCTTLNIMILEMPKK